MAMHSTESQLPLFTYFGHHKCASMWIREIIADVCSLTNMRLAQVSRASDLPNSDFSAFLAATQPDFLVYSNAELQHVASLGKLRGFHVVRDPRDIIVSGYFSHLYSHPVNSWPGLAEHRERLRKVDRRQGLLLEIEFNTRVLQDIFEWNYQNPDILELRMENLIHNPYEEFVDIFKFLGLTRRAGALIESREEILHVLLAAFHQWRMKGHRQRASKQQPSSGPPERTRSWPRIRRRYVASANLLQAVYRNRFETKAAGRHIGQENERSHYRKGATGDWINYFEDVHVTEFKRRFNDGLLRLGYEIDSDWNKTKYVRQ